MHPQHSTPPHLDGGPEGRYFAALNKGIFQIQRCTACEKHVFYPRTLCPHCGNDDLQWTEPAGTGTVYSYSVIAGRPGTDTDYHVALIDLDEGVRIMSRIEDVSSAHLYIGMRVEARVKLEDEKGLVVFVQTGGTV